MIGNAKLKYMDQDQKHREEKKYAPVEWNTLNRRIIKAMSASRYGIITVITVYTPTEEATTDLEVDFYKRCQDVTNSKPKRDIVIN